MSPGRASIVGFALLFATVGAAWTVYRSLREPPALHSLLVDAVDRDPPMEARLVGFHYRPTEPGESAGRETTATDTLRAIGGLEPSARRRLRATSDPATLHALALAEFLSGEPGAPAGSIALDRAIAMLRGVKGADPETARRVADLAALLLHRGSARRDVDDLLEALDLSRRAVESAPDLLEANYNLALACDHLYLWHRARDLYRRYLALDPTSEWGRRARSRLLELEEALDSSGRGGVAIAQLREAASSGRTGDLDELVARAPSLARDVGANELLPAWADATLKDAKDEAVALKKAAKAIGEALAELCGDRWVADSVRSATDDRSARGLVAWGRAARLGTRRSYENATRDLEETIDLLGPAGSPLAREAAYYLAVHSYQQGKYLASYRALESLAEADPEAAYPGLLRKTRRMQGTIHHVWGNLDSARFRYEEAVRLASACGERDAETNDELSLAVVHYNLGHPEATALWWQAVEDRREITRIDYLYLVFATAADLLSAEKRAHEATFFRQEAAVIAAESGDPIVQSDGSLKLAKTRLEIGETEAALENLADSRRSAARIESESVREFMDMEVLQLQAAALAGSDPESSTALLEEVVTRVQRVGYWRILPRVLLASAQQLMKQGLVEEARDRLNHAAERITQQAAGIVDLEERLAFLSEATPIYDELAWLAWDSGDFGEALEQYRVVRKLGHTVPVDDLWQPEGLVESMSDSELGLVYAFRDESAVAWVLTRHGIEGRSLALERASLTELSQQARDAWLHREAVAAREALARLYEELVAPVAGDLEGKVHLRIVPYGRFGAVPFSALIDRRGRFLAQGFRISYSLLGQPESESARRTASGEAVTPGKVLAIGDPAFSEIRYPDLLRLAGARGEVEGVRRVYRGGEILRGESATPAAVARLLTEASVVHLATHGVVDPSNPLRSHLVLTPREDGVSAGEGRFEESEGLTALEILDLDLGRVEVAVLSACEAASLGSVREGVEVGLASAFIAAGARAVVASPWPQADGRDSEVLIDFHRRLRRGLPASVALREAKLEQLARADGDRLASGLTLGVYEAW